MDDTWYSMSFSACSLSSSLDCLKNLKKRNKRASEHCADSFGKLRPAIALHLLGKSLEGDIVAVKVGVEGVVCVRGIVLHAANQGSNNNRVVFLDRSNGWLTRTKIVVPVSQFTWDWGRIQHDWILGRCVLT
jgi:hypothetical protein